MQVILWQLLWLRALSHHFPVMDRRGFGNKCSAGSTGCLLLGCLVLWRAKA